MHMIRFIEKIFCPEKILKGYNSKNIYSFCLIIRNSFTTFIYKIIFELNWIWNIYFYWNSRLGVFWQIVRRWCKRINAYKIESLVYMVGTCTFPYNDFIVLLYLDITLQNNTRSARFFSLFFRFVSIETFKICLNG